jgi:hypothetical protein
LQENLGFQPTNSMKPEKSIVIFNKCLVNSPLLIIDVNIRPGEKRKIQVFEGDTAEKLANNFAIENSTLFNFLIVYKFRTG